MTIRVATRAFNLYTTSAVYRVPETWNKWSARAEHHPVRNKSRDAYIVIFPISPPTEERGVPLRQSSAITGEDISSSTSSTIQQLYECGFEGGRGSGRWPKAVVNRNYVPSTKPANYDQNVCSVFKLVLC